MGLDVDRGELLRRDLLAEGVSPLVETRTHDEAAAVRRVRDQVDDRLVGAERSAAPVDRDEREEAVLDLVPLTRAGREMADVDHETESVGELLQLVLPDARAVAVAAARVSGDEELARLRVAERTNLLPPRLDRGDGELRRVVVDAHADEAIVRADVVHAVRNRLADRLVWEVVDVDQLGLPLGLSLAATVLEVAHELLLLGVDGDHWDTAFEATLGGRVDVLELCVSIGTF